MYARVIRASFAPDRVDEAIQLWQAAVAPTAVQQQGFKNARLLVDRASGRVMSIGLWETEADFQRSIDWNAEQLTRFIALFAAPPSIEHYELCAEVS